MRDAECIEFLQWALPRLDLRWAGFRKPRRQVCRRITQRVSALGLSGLAEYRRTLESEERGTGECAVLDLLCRVTISRFFRDRRVFEALGRKVLPQLAHAAEGEGRTALRAWSVGCASGEEPYSLRILWHFEVTPQADGLELEIVATDIDEHLLKRALRARYPAGSLREVPDSWKGEAFRQEETGEFVLRESFRRGVELRLEDVRVTAPPGRFDLVLCRNLAWTYFGESAQRRVLARIASALRPGGLLVVGGHEVLPGDGDDGTVFELLERSTYSKRSRPKASREETSATQ